MDKGTLSAYIKEILKEKKVKEGTCGYGVKGKLGKKPAGSHLLSKKDLEEEFLTPNEIGDEAVEKEGFLPGEASRKTQAKIDEVTRELKAAKDEYGKATEAPAKKKTKEPLATETADKLIDDIIGAPKVNAKTKRKLESIQKESKAKADDAISKAEEIDSITEEMNDKLDDDLCI